MLSKKNMERGKKLFLEEKIPSKYGQVKGGETGGHFSLSLLSSSILLLSRWSMRIIQPQNFIFGLEFTSASICPPKKKTLSPFF